MITFGAATAAAVAALPKPVRGLMERYVMPTEADRARAQSNNTNYFSLLGTGKEGGIGTTGKLLAR